MNIKPMLAALRGVTAYKDVLSRPVMECALRLTTCAAQGDGLGGLEAYTDLFYQLRVEGQPGLGHWLGEALRWSEGPYPMLVQRGDRDPALEQAAKLDISAFELLASVDCDKWLAQLGRLLDSDYQGVLTSLPRWQGGVPFSFDGLTRAYQQEGAGRFARYQAFVWDSGELIPVARPDCPAASELLGYDYQVDGNIDYSFTLSLKSDLSQPQDISNYFYSQLNDLSDQLRAYEVSVDGRAIGTVRDRDALNAMLEELKSQFVNENTISSSFVESVTVSDVYAVDELMTPEELRAALEANTTGETTYTVVRGDTYNGIAYANDMSLSDLMALNPEASINRLMVGDVRNVKEIIPTLSVRTAERVTYSEPIPCPVEEKEDSSMYKGDSKVLVQGEEGEAMVSADVTYVNGVEKERKVTGSSTLREPTVTVKAVGTKEKPKTASTGKYIWPVSSHRINSYFGNRKIFGKSGFHSGIDLHASYGETVKAADGGTVTKAGTSGGYGKLVVIRHDNGTETYYAHNSSLLVSVGQKVYQGQAIAKAGSTGRSSGVHCHFEVRIRGTAVNPLNYLK